MTHGRHCSCMPCSLEEWANILLPCGEHPQGCPPQLPIWRPLTMGEYPPPGPTRLGPTRECGHRVILVYAPPLPYSAFEEHE
jgi:hypothetical protein